MDRVNRLRPTRGGLRVSDEDLTSLLRAINAAHEEGDSLEVIEVLEVADNDVRSVPALDLRGARQALGIPHKSRQRDVTGRGSSVSQGAMLLLLGLGLRRGDGRGIGRRELLQAALTLVGGLVVSACNQPSPCTPPECDPGDGTRVAPVPVGGVRATPRVADGGGDASEPDDAGLPDRGTNAAPCPPSACVGGGDYGGYVVGGGVG